MWKVPLKTAQVRLRGPRTGAQLARTTMFGRRSEGPARGSNTSPAERALPPQWPGRSRRYPGARAFLVAFSAMAESAASASWCPRPPTAATAEAATAASSIDSLSSSSSNRSSHRTANRTAAPAHAGRQVPSAPAPRRATAGRAPAPLPRRWRRCRTVNQVASPDG